MRQKNDIENCILALPLQLCALCDLKSINGRKIEFFYVFSPQSEQCSKFGSSD